jgi:hypothetical protein
MCQLCCALPSQVWKFESDSTLSDALSGNLGQWPEDIEEIMLGKVDERQPVEKREAAVREGWQEAVLCLQGSRIHCRQFSTSSATKDRMTHLVSC